MATQIDLEDAVLFAFRQACAERRFDVAEHLLEALELMARSDAQAEPLAEAYKLLFPEGDPTR